MKQTDKKIINRTEPDKNNDNNHINDDEYYYGNNEGIQKHYDEDCM